MSHRQSGGWKHESAVERYSVFVRWWWNILCFLHVWLVNAHLHTISVFFSFRTGHFCVIRFSNHRLQVRFSSSLSMYGNIHECTHIAVVSDMMFLWDGWQISTFSMRHHANCSPLCQLTCIYSPIIKYHETTQTFEYTKSNNPKLHSHGKSTSTLF